MEGLSDGENTLIALARVRARGVDHSLSTNLEVHLVQRRGPNPSASCWYFFIGCVKARFIARFILLFVGGLWRGSRSVHSRGFFYGKIVRFVKPYMGYISSNKITLPSGHEPGEYTAETVNGSTELSNFSAKKFQCT